MCEEEPAALLRREVICLAANCCTPLGPTCECIKDFQMSSCIKHVSDSDMFFQNGLSSFPRRSKCPHEATRSQYDVMWNRGFCLRHQSPRWVPSFVDIKFRAMRQSIISLRELQNRWHARRSLEQCYMIFEKPYLTLRHDKMTGWQENKNCIELPGSLWKWSWRGTEACQSWWHKCRGLRDFEKESVLLHPAPASIHLILSFQSYHFLFLFCFKTTKSILYHIMQIFK